MIRFLAILAAVLLTIPAFLPNTAFANYTTHLTYVTNPISNGQITIPSATYTVAMDACKRNVNAHTTQTARRLVTITVCDPNQANTGTLYATYTYYQGTSTTLFTHSNLAVATKTGECSSGTHYYPLGFPTESPAPECTGTCPVGQTLNTLTNTCEDNCKPLKGAETQFFTSTPSMSEKCLDGCLVSPLDGSCGFNQAGQQGCFFNGTFTGIGCTVPNENQPPNTPEYDCIKNGQSYGLVNGVAVCVPKNSAGSAPIDDLQKKSKTTNDPNANTKSDVEVIKKGDSVEKKTTTQNPDGSTSTKIENQDFAGFCEENPNSQLCKASEDLCQKNPDIPACKDWCDKPENTTKIACMDKGDDLTPEEIQTDEINLNVTPSGGIPSAAGCPVPESVTIGGHTISLSYDPICQYASAFRVLVILFAWLSAAYIVSAAINKD